MMLHEFLTENRQLLIARCREKVAKRFEPTEAASSIENGVPLFLEQLSQTLALEQTTSARCGEPEATPAPTEIGRAAALHGAELLRRGFTIDQVVHDYGDVCQCVTALAVERTTPISTDEFRTLNRCLDNAIADAVAAFGAASKASAEARAQTLQQRLYRRPPAAQRDRPSVIHGNQDGQYRPRGSHGRSANAHLERTRRAHRPAPASPLK